MSLLTSAEIAVPRNRLDVDRGRIEWIDAARGIGIILVVYGHVLQGLLAAGLLSKSNPLWLSDYIIYTFHMPIFFVLAGLNVKSSLKKGAAIFLLGKLWTVAYPYFLWSAIQGGIQIHMAELAPGAVNHARSPLFMETILWRPIAQFWFLYALFICHMIAPLALSRRWICLLLGAGSLCLSAFGHGRPTSYMLTFYILGIIVGDHIMQWRPSFQSTLVEGLICTGLFAAAAHLGRAASAVDPESIYSLPASLLGICMVFLFSRAIIYASKRMTRIFAIVGGMSMTIYVLHGLVESSARLMLRRLGLLQPAEHLLFGLVAGIGLPMAAHILLGKLHLLTPLGLAPWKRRSFVPLIPHPATGKDLLNVPALENTAG
jgi:fucose 4-O-acetylase-like acetyltransferase